MPPEKKPSKKAVTLGRSSIVLLFVIVFLGMGVMFGLGHYAGRRQGPLMYDYRDMRAQLSDIKKALAANEIKKGQVREKPANLTQEARDNTGEHLMYEPSAASARDYTPRTVSSVLQPAVKVLKELMAAGSSGKKEAAKPETAGAEASAATPGAAESQAVWTVQVAAVTSAADAEKLVAKLSKKGYPAWVMVVKRTGGDDVQRVRVGRYGSRAQAELVRKALAETASESFVTKIE